MGEIINLTKFSQYQYIIKITASYCVYEIYVKSITDINAAQLICIAGFEMKNYLVKDHQTFNYLLDIKYKITENDESFKRNI